MELTDVQQHLDPLIYSALQRWGLLTTRLIQTQMPYVKNVTYKNAFDAFNAYRAKEPHYQTLTGVFEKSAAENLFSALWIKERDAKQK